MSDYEWDHVEKLEWAERHLKKLEAFIAGRHPYAVVLDYDTGAGEYVAKVAQMEPIYLDIRLMLSDVIHSTRSALDNLAFGLAVKESGWDVAVTSPSIQFVISYSDAQYHGTPKTKCPCCKRQGKQGDRAGIDLFSGEAKRVMDEFQPYQRSNPPTDEPLYILKVLSNQDKHRRIVVTTSYGKGTLGLNGPGASPDIIAINRPVKHDSEVARWVCPYHPDIKHNGQLALQVSFTQGHPGAGREVVQFFKELHIWIKEIFVRLEPLL